MAAVWEVRLNDGSFLLVEAAEEQDLAKEFMKKRGGLWSPVPRVALRHALISSVRPVVQAVQEVQHAKDANKEANEGRPKRLRVVVRGFTENKT